MKRKKKAGLRLLDTTFRDGNQSLLSGALTGEEIVPIAAMMDGVGFTAMEAFGGATFETQVRRGEDPWEYLRQLAKATPDTPIQALIRGQNLVANRNFADDTVELFVKHAVSCGVDVFRVFDPLNDLRNMETAIAAALKAYMAAVEAGADTLDVAMSPLAWGTSQPAAESVVAALQGGEYDTGLDLDRMWEANNALEALKRSHQADISPVADRIDADILRYHMPGLMLEDIYRQLGSHEAGARISEVLDEANRVRLELGYPPLVAPVRQMIATQAVYNVIGGERYATVTQELKDYLQGLYGRPPVAADPELRRLVLGREEPITVRPGDVLEPQVEMARAQVRKMGQGPTDDAVLIQLLFPNAAPAYHRRGDEKSRVKKTEAPAPAAVAADPPAAAPSPAPADDPPPSPMSTAEFEVEVEGEVFKVRVTGAGMAVTPAATAGAAPSPQSKPAPKSGEGTVIAPMQGLIVKIPIKAGDDVKLGDVVAVLEAMKMQNDIVTTVAGRVQNIYVKEGEVVGPNQPLLAIG